MRLFQWCMILIPVLAIAGCAGGNYTILEPILPPPAPVVIAQGHRPVVAIGPIGVPGYILRASIVAESDINIANISSADQELSFLRRDIPAVVTINFERLLTPAGMAVVSTGIATQADFRIAVDIHALDVTPFDVLDTRAQWSLYRSGAADPLIIRDVTFTTPITGRDDAAIRSAMSRSLADVTRVIANDFEAFLATR
ncbi:MAG: PqiC family protein [Syntrophorhabdaceae bacterium]